MLKKACRWVLLEHCSLNTEGLEKSKTISISPWEEVMPCLNILQMMGSVIKLKTLYEGSSPRMLKCMGSSG